jgi:Protein of unknown function (DUF2867)
MSTPRTTAWRRPAPAALRALDTFDRTDYSDVFTATATRPVEMTPEQLARAVLQPESLGARAVVAVAYAVQRTVLGMRLTAAGAPHGVMGWRIAARGENWVRLEADSRLMSGHLVLRGDGRDVECATFVQYNSRLAALVWPPVSLLHRQVGLALMRSALQVLESQQHNGRDARRRVAGTRVPNSVHAAHPWVINRIAPDFTLLDAWALPVEGGREDFTAFLRTFAALDPTRADSAPTRALFALRDRLGELLGWDDATRARPIPGCTETALSARLPEDLRGTATRPLVAGRHSFVPLYQTGDEWAAEISNATVHGVLQLTWVDGGDGRHHARLGVYVKPRGLLGAAYLRTIAPFRHLVVYPALLGQVGRAWNASRA